MRLYFYKHTLTIVRNFCSTSRLFMSTARWESPGERDAIPKVIIKCRQHRSVGVSLLSPFIKSPAFENRPKAYHSNSTSCPRLYSHCILPTFLYSTDTFDIYSLSLKVLIYFPICYFLGSFPGADFRSLVILI